MSWGELSVDGGVPHRVVVVVVGGVLVHSLNLASLYGGGVEKHLHPHPSNTSEEEALGTGWATLSALCFD